MTTDVVVGSVEASAFTVPTDGPEADGTLLWEETTIVVVRVASGDPALPRGVGWTYAPAATAALVSEILAGEVVGASALDVAGAWQAMTSRARNAGGGLGLSAMAVAAVDVALWDLKARLLDVPLHHLFGSVRADVPVYGSGGFTTYDDRRLADQVAAWRDLGADQVKLKVGEGGGAREDRDVERTGLVRAVAGDDAGVFVDANGGYSVKQAVRVGRRYDQLGVTWFEEPVSSRDLAGLRHVRHGVTADVTAGEYGSDLAYFEDMCAAGAVDCLQVDATRCGGYTGWLRACAVAAAHGVQVSAHCAPTLHAPVAAATPGLRHVEWFHDHARIESAFCHPGPRVVDGRIVLSEAPGLGFDLEPDELPWRRTA